MALESKFAGCLIDDAPPIAESGWQASLKSERMRAECATKPTKYALAKARDG
jgi:hypothetical protein